MATMEQIQELVTRIQAREVREQEIVSRGQALQGQVQHLTTQLTTAQQQATNVSGPVGGTSATGTVDTRALGKPDVFDGVEAKWHDFRVIFKAYCSCLNQRLGTLMSNVEGNLSGSYTNQGLDPRDMSCSIQLYYILRLLCRQQPLTLIVNSGEQKGLTAWQRLVEHYEPQQRTRVAGQLQPILAWKFAGDIEGRMEAFEREILRYENASGDVVSDALRI
eukprot:5903734-Amphidinium_carterae.1